jgi:protein TonB
MPLLRLRGSLTQPAFSLKGLLSRSDRRIGGRAPGLLLAFLVEALLILAVLTLGSTVKPRDEGDAGVTVVRFKAAARTHEASTSPRPKQETKRPDQPRLPKTAPTDRTVIIPPKDGSKVPEPSFIRLSPTDMAAIDISPGPPKSGPASKVDQPMIGPPDTRMRVQDTPRVSGSGPNGEPLYAASWYREPYDDELRGYLSTASGPGWGLIACRTAPDYRVEDCVEIDEYPTGSNIARSVLAAAWQFRVRPPRIGGEAKIGEWVRIRIDYELNSRSRR